MLHVRANMADPAVARVANAFASNVIIDGEGPDGSLRREASAVDTPTVTVELGEAHRFQRPLIDAALEGVLSVMAEFGMLDAEPVKWPGWRTVIEGSDEKTWLRADAGGLVDMHHDRGSLVEAGETVCTISNPFKTDVTGIEAPFTGLLIGTPQNPLVYPGNPLCHLVALEGATLRAYRQVHDGTVE